MSKAVVQSVLDAHPEFKTNPDRDDAKMRVLPFVVAALNAAMHTSSWGVLMKTDQGNKVPNDIVCWKPTREIVDCLTDHEAIWDEKGVAPNPAWVWAPTPGFQTPPIIVPPPQPPKQPDVTLQEVVDAITAPLISLIRQEADRLYAQHERTFADLTRQNSELKSILLQTGGKDFSIQGAMLPSVAQDTTKTVHLSQQSIDRIIAVGAPLLARILDRK
jgi:hypothetical protein